MHRFLRLSPLLALALALPLVSHAQTLRITPALIDASHSVEQALETHKGHASTSIEGQGGILTLDYQSTEPLEVFLVPLRPDETYTPTDYLRFTLPLTEQGTVEVDLTVSPGWSPRNTKWLVTLLSSDEKAGAAFTGIRFTESGAPPTVLVALRHLFTKEPYTPSSFHALRGYRMLGVSLTISLGLLTIALALSALAFVTKVKRRSMALGVLLVGTLVYQTRFSLDLLRFTKEHLTEYAHGTYDEAGSIHTVATFLRTLASGKESKTTVYVCRDGTTFKEKLLRYFAYPIRISSEASDAATADYAVVMNKFKWGFETNVTKDASVTLLRCGDLERPSQKLTTFDDGSIVFRLLSSPDSSS